MKNEAEDRQGDWDALEERLLEFGARIGLVVDALPESRLGRHVAGQLVRCGTSPAPNYAEACAAESRADFVHKLRIVLKELRGIPHLAAALREVEVASSQEATRHHRRVHPVDEHHRQIHRHGKGQCQRPAQSLASILPFAFFTLHFAFQFRFNLSSRRRS
jgi:four helix bundle protein